MHKQMQIKLKTFMQSCYKTDWPTLTDPHRPTTSQRTHTSMKWGVSKIIPNVFHQGQSSDLGKNFSLPRGINKSMSARHDVENVTTVVKYCYLTLFAGLPCALLVYQGCCLLHHFTDEHWIIGKHTWEHLQVHTPVNKCITNYTPENTWKYSAHW